MEFLSTLPGRGATKTPTLSLSASAISIHAPREGSDCNASIEANKPEVFLSTLPARGATVEQGRNPALPSFLPTLPARGATSGHRSVRPPASNFYPHSPGG